MSRTRSTCTRAARRMHALIAVSVLVLVRQSGAVDIGIPPQHGSPLELGLAGYALFVSGRDLEKARQNSGSMFLPEDQQDVPIDVEFDPNEALTAAFLVVHKGQIVAERYAPGITKDTQLESWSMGKSLTATLVGLLIHQGEIELDQPAPVPAWQSENDPRRTITIRNLLNMSSGLHFIAPRDPDFGEESGYPDHMYIYTGAIDTFEFSIDRPLQFPVNTEGRYRNSDPLTLGYVVRETLPLPADAYYMAGGGGQRTFVVPSLDLVVVRLGHFRGNRPGMEALNGALARLTEGLSADGN